MSFFLDHLPHIGLALVGVALFIWMERADRQARAVGAGDGGEDGEQPSYGPRATQAGGLVISVALVTSVAALVLQSVRNSPPGGSLVLTYLTAGLAAAIWAGWSMPGRLPVAVRQRMGRLGRGTLRLVVFTALTWGFVFGGMLLSQGVVLPGTGH